MAALWNKLRQEVRATVDDFREKGAIAVLKETALETRDIATSLGGDLLNGVKELLAEPILHVESIPVRGAVAPLECPDGSVVQATVVEVDAVSDPPRATVTYPGLSQLLVVTVSVGTSAPAQHFSVGTPPIEQEEEVADNADGQPAVASSPADMSLLDCFKQDYRDTVNDFKEKGAVGAVRDVAFDAANMVGTTASKAASSARSLVTDITQSADTSEPSEVPASDGAAAAGDSASASASASDSGASASASATEAAAGSESAGGSVNLLDLPLFDSLKQEWSNTVQDFREKGAMGAVKDAALDAKDMIGSTARSAVSGAKSFVLSANAGDGSGEQASSGEFNRECSQIPLFDGLKKGYHSTVQDIQEKGAVGAVRDAALDAADLVRDSASLALDGARRASDSLLGAPTGAAAQAEEGEGVETPGSSAASSEPRVRRFEPPARVEEAEVAKSGKEAEELID